MTYKIANDLAQRRARQLWLRDLQGKAFEALPREEQRANLVRARTAIVERIIALPKKCAERRALAQDVIVLDERIHALRPRRKGPVGLQQHFINVARERLQPFVFKTMMDEACERARKEEQA